MCIAGKDGEAHDINNRCNPSGKQFGNSEKYYRSAHLFCLI